MSGGPYALGIDFGTESVRVGIFDMEGTPIVFTGEVYGLAHPYPGWAELTPRPFREKMTGVNRHP